MKLHHFRNVIAIAEQGSLRAAARSLQLAQPALTRSLGEIERELGAPLFERQTRGMVLTPIGQTFVRRATLVLNDVRRAREEVDQLQGGSGGSVVVGLSIAAHIAMLPQAIKPFRTRYPTSHLHIIEGFYPTLEAGLRNGTVDFYIGPKPQGPLPAEFVQTDLFTNTRTVLCRKGHPLSSATSLKDLVDADWATTSITSLAEEELSELFKSLDLPQPRLALRSQSALTLIVSIAYSDLLAMAPKQWIEFSPTADILRTIEVKEALPAPTIVLIQRGIVPLTPAASFLADLMQKSAPTSAQNAARQKLAAPTA